MRRSLIHSESTVLARTLVAFLTLMVALTPMSSHAVGFIFAGEGNANSITHPSGYTGTGGTLTVTVGINPASPNASSMVVSTQNVIATWNARVATTGNLDFSGTVPGGFIDFESVLLHEMGHSIGLAHPNLGTDVASGTQRESTRSADGVNNVFNLNAGTDTLFGSADDVRGDDINLFWYRTTTNDPVTIVAGPYDSTNYTRNVASLPGGDLFPANPDRTVNNTIFGFANTEPAMQQGSFFGEAQRTLGIDDVAGVSYGMSGLNETAGNGDDYTLVLSYAGLTTSADIVVQFDNSETGFAVSKSFGTTIAATDHFRITANNIYFHTGFNWFYTAPLFPSVQSITRADSDPTNASTVDFTVTFDDPVTGVDTSDFAVTTGGSTSGTSVTGISGSGNVYTVTVDTGSGDGTVRLDVSDDDTITSIATSATLGDTGLGNGDFTSGELYTIDKTAPTIGIGAPSSASVTSGSSPVTYPVTYTGADTFNLTAGDVSLVTTGTADGNVSVLNGTTSTPTVVITSIIGEGTIGILAIASGTASDNAGNLAPAAGPSATFSVVLASFPSTDVPKAIADLSTITSTIVVPASKTISNITDLNVNIDITHTNDADLDVTLESPNGTVVELFTDVGGAGANFTTTNLDDEAGTAITAGSAPFTGSFQPEGALSDYDGESAIGTWTLTITDDTAPGTGTLNSWSLEIEAGTPALPAAQRWALAITVLGIIASVAMLLRRRQRRSSTAH